MKKTKELFNYSIEQLKNNKYLHYIIIVIIGIILSSFLTQIQIRDTHDGSLHMLRLIGTKDTLDINQFPPLINQNYCRGVGYSMNLFYPPLVTYIPLLIKLFVPTYAASLKIFGGLCIVLSGITMYKFSYQVSKNRLVSLFSAIFYLIAPYKLANVYVRFAIGEFAALVFIPLVFMGLYNLFKQDRKKHYYIAIGAIGLMLSHTVSTIYTALFCILFVLLNIKKLKEKEIITKCLINVIFILIVSMLFWMPLLEATSKADYVIMNDTLMRTNGDFAYQNTMSFLELFKNREENVTTFLLGIPTIFAMLLTVLTYRKIDDKYKEFYLICIIFSLISLFMTSRFFPWKVMPGFICKLQYPWRMLGFMVFFISFVCGTNLQIFIKEFLKKDILRIIFLTIFIVLAIFSSINIMSQFFAEDKNKDMQYETEILENKKITHLRINREYMPVKALALKNIDIIIREDKTYILEGKANIINENKENLTDIIKIENVKKDTILEFPYFYYIGYEVIVETNDNVYKIIPTESKNGYLSCLIENDIDNAIVTVKYVGTVITKISYIVSLIGLILFIVYIIYEKKKEVKDDKN